MLHTPPQNARYLTCSKLVVNLVLLGTHLTIYQKKTSLYYINHLFVQFWNIAVLFGHLILSCITKKLKKNPEKSYQIGKISD